MTSVAECIIGRAVRGIVLLHGRCTTNRSGHSRLERCYRPASTSQSCTYSLLPACALGFSRHAGILADSTGLPTGIPVHQQGDLRGGDRNTSMESAARCSETSISASRHAASLSSDSSEAIGAFDGLVSHREWQFRPTAHVFLVGGVSASACPRGVGRVACDEPHILAEAGGRDDVPAVCRIRPPLVRGRAADQPGIAWPGARLAAHGASPRAVVGRRADRADFGGVLGHVL
jgi:hypothetical protein